jgi:hypothetical protein
MSLKKDLEKQKLLDLKQTYLICFFFSVITLIGALIYQLNGLYYVGINLKFQEPTIINSGILFLGFIVFAIMTYSTKRQLNKTELSDNKDCKSKL